jgi:DNA-binding SARP family transcriptional activator
VTSSWSGSAVIRTDAQFRILGPLEVVTLDGRAVPIPRAERALLAVLLLFAGQPCSQDLLARALWADRLPEHPAVALRVSASRLRKSLGPAHCLTRVFGSYRADPESDNTDLGRFRTLHAEAASRAKNDDRRGAARALESALAYWRRPFLADLPTSPYIAAEAESLLEQRRRAELELTDLLLSLGEHERIVPDLHARVILDPGSERAWQQLILALHLSGRRGEALAALDKARKTLANGYGTPHTVGLQSTLAIVLADDAPARASRFTPGIHLAGRGPVLASPPRVKPGLSGPARAYSAAGDPGDASASA